VQARLFDTVGALYDALGSLQKAEELLNRSIDIRRKRLTLDERQPLTPLNTSEI
jgi:hypothetical protein